MILTFESSLKDLTKSSETVLRNTSSTIETSHTVHRELNRTNPEKPFLFPTILNSSEPFTTDKRKDLQQPRDGSLQLLHLKAIYMAATARNLVVDEGEDILGSLVCDWDLGKRDRGTEGFFVSQLNKAP
jgi:hypothetical protein